MDTVYLIQLLQKRGNLKGFAEEEKQRFAKQLLQHFFFYDPYKDDIINPVRNKRYWAKSLQRLFLNNLESFKSKMDWRLPTEKEWKQEVEKLHLKKVRAFNFRKVVSYFKWLGLILGSVIAVYVELYLGIAIGLYLVYLDYNIFEKVSGVTARVQGEFVVSQKWRENNKLYFFGSLFLLIVFAGAVYMYTKSIGMVVLVLIANRFLVVGPVVKGLCSSVFKGTVMVAEMDDLFKEINRGNHNERRDIFGRRIKADD